MGTGTPFLTGVRLIERTPSADEPPLLIKRLLHSGLAAASGQEIVYRSDVRYGYPELGRRVCRLANMLTTLGVTAGQTVGVLDWDSHRYLECYFAVPGIGAVLHMVNVRLSPEQILYTINHARDDVLLVHRDFVPLIEGMRDRIETVVTFIVLNDDGEVPKSTVPFCGEYEELVGQQPSTYVFPDFEEDACATTFYTTGTTGLPKGVSFSHRQLVLHTLSLALALTAPGEKGRLHRGAVYMPITPMFHVHAWGIPFIATMLGLKQVYPGRYDVEKLIALRQQEGVTFSHCVPTLLHMLVSHAPSQHVDFSGWTFVIGGSALTAGLAAQAKARGMDVFTGYGMSETCPILTLGQPPEPSDDLDEEAEIAICTKAGRPLPLVELTIDSGIVDAAVPAEQRSGEVVVRAPWLTQAYVGNPPASEQLWEGGRLHTGDIGVVDEAGRLRITDRVKDVIKTGGEWVSSLEIEGLISRHAGVSEVAVIGIPDQRWGERPLALIVAREGYGGSITRSAIADFLTPLCESGQISKWAIPDVVEVDTILKTSVGKIDKKALRAEFSAAG